MVLESLLTFKESPKHLLLSGFVFATVAVLVSVSLFPRSASMVMVAFMTMPSIYIFTQLFKQISVEEIDAKGLKEILTSNFKVAETYMFLFLGMTIGVALWFSILPKDTVLAIFSEQIWNLQQLGRASGLMQGGLTGTEFDLLVTIASNNIRLVLLCALLSFVFGTGSLFILAWNASVMGSAVGSIVFQLKEAGAALEFAFFQGMTMGVTYFALHLVPEVLAYFYAAIGGAFISIAMLRYKPFSPESNKLLYVAIGVIGIAVVFILAGAFIEVFISYYIQSMFV